MKNIRHIAEFNNCPLHFSRWTRARYAIFKTIGRVVNISRLSVAIAQWVGYVVDHVQEVFLACQEKEEEDEALTGLESLENEFLLAMAVTNAKGDVTENRYELKYLSGRLLENYQ